MAMQQSFKMSFYGFRIYVGWVQSETIFNLTIHNPLGISKKISTSRQEGRFNYFGYQREFHIVAFYNVGFYTPSKIKAEKTKLCSIVKYCVIAFTKSE